ncbi:MAG: hypothetical protein ACK421_05235 [Pseudanabaenaceae cyanobacterium]
MAVDYLEPEWKFFEGHPHPIGSLPRFLGYVFFWLQPPTKTYLITDQRILVEKGLFSQPVHTIEL